MPRASKSFTAQIESLEVGESHVRLERVPVTKATDTAIKEKLDTARNGVAQITNRLRKAGKGDFAVESVTMLSPDRKSVFCMAVTTRTEAEEIDI